ncbi:MAG: endopeptidase La [Ignavibacteria bacterium]|nr:endopeptidase La [Ignavibacteria bacterium]
MAGINSKVNLKIETEKDVNNYSVPKKLTILTLRDIVIFPNMIFPVLIGRPSSLKAVAEAVERDKYIFVTSQKSANVDDPEFNDIFWNGTTAKIIQILRLPNNLLKVLVEGLYQSKIVKAYKNTEYMEANIEPVGITFSDEDKELQALVRQCSDLFVEYVKNSHVIPPEIVNAFENIEDPLRKMYFGVANIQTKVEVKQKILDLTSLTKQYFEFSSILTSELEMLKLEEEIGTKVHNSIQKTQKKYFIQEQIRALQNELGEDDDASPELAAMKAAIEKAEMPELVRNKALEEFDKLKKIPTMSPEYSVNRNYLDFLCAMPWKIRTDDNLNILHVKKILDEDHFDLEKPKERILEYIAILNLVGQLRRQILCFVGPPGTGKTSLARSIARALGRKFVRFSLGGIRDEAEIRGHRRTYIGALPGKIIQSMKKAGAVNPVILLDEIDKMSMDFRGDPSSALLEVLDPEQNVAFNDHYLEVDYDLSNVMFITTANVRFDIPLPLQDRMEIIELSSYLEPEKIEIAKRHILPKLMEEYGLKNFNILLQDESLFKIIREYTREAGVRNLERSIGSVLRKLAKELVQDFIQSNSTPDNEDESAIKIALKDNPIFLKKLKKMKIVIKPEKVEEYLKAPKFKDKRDKLDDKVGVANGLAWTSVGGEILPIEVTIMPGAEKLTLTGKLGDVMKESATAALSYLRSNAEALSVPVKFNKGKEVHIHIPEGAIPKDGPSAGITMAAALISAASGRPIRGDVAMTGEITLRGNILPIGGLNEKLLAAKRAGIMNVIIPKDNERDIEDVNEIIKKDMTLIPVDNISQALEHIFRN